MISIIGMKRQKTLMDAKNKKKVDFLDVMSDVLDDKKKNTKISSLLTYLRKDNRIVRSSDNQQTGYWVLVENKRE